MESFSPLDDNLNDDLSLDSNIKAFLQEAARWSKLLSIIGFVCIGLVIMGGMIFAFTMGLGAFMLDSQLGDLSPQAGVGFVMVIFYFGFGVLLFFPVLYLYRFATHMKKALRVNDQLLLQSAFANLKSHYKYIGIFTLLLFAFYILAIVVGSLLMTI